jgi:hypothetical protein
MKPRLTILIILTAAWLSGCAVGNKYDYQLETLPLPVTGESTMGVAVIESRPYVLDGDKAPNFVGLQRGGFGNPFDVTTESGEPLVADMRDSIVDGLRARGFEATALSLRTNDGEAVAVAASRDGLDRVAVLDVRDWKSDAMARVTMHYDLILAVYDGGGTLLAETTRAKVGAIGGAGFESANASTVAQQFERIMVDMFGTPEIREALE